MTTRRRPADEGTARSKPRTPKPTDEEDLQTKDPSEMPLEPQDPVKPPDPAS